MVESAFLSQFFHIVLFRNIHLPGLYEHLPWSRWDVSWFLLHTCLFGCSCPSPPSELLIWLQGRGEQFIWEGARNPPLFIGHRLGEWQVIGQEKREASGDGYELKSPLEGIYGWKINMIFLPNKREAKIWTPKKNVTGISKALRNS